MATIYYPDCAEDILEHLCDACPTDTESGRVRSIAYIHKDIYPAIIADPSNATLWETYIASQQIIIIPQVNGTFDGGTEVTQPGYGDTKERITGYDFSLNYKDPSYRLNGEFYNTLKRARNYHVAWRTETLIHFSENTVTAIPKNPVTENLTDDIVWDVTVNWSGSELSEPYDTPEGIFTCFGYL